MAMTVTTLEGPVRVLDVTVEVVCPVGYVPSSKTLGQDLQTRLHRRVNNAFAEEAELIRRAYRAGIMLLDAWCLKGDVVATIVRERPGDRLVGVVVRVTVTGVMG
jgi:hypothetical protein